MEKTKEFLWKYRIWLISALGLAGTGLIKPALWSSQNLIGIMKSMVPYGIVALGLAMTLLAGEIDISIGSVMALSSVIFAVTFHQFPIFVAVVISLSAALLVGVVNGFLIAYKKLPAFLVSVAAMVTVRGYALWISKEQPISVNSQLLLKLNNTMIAKRVPLLFIFLLLCAILLELFLRNTQIGRNIYAVGGDSQVAKAHGLNTEKYKFYCLVFCSFMAGLGGLLLTLRMNSGSPSIAQDAMPSILPMIVIGGTSISGGKGGMMRTVSGILLMNLIFNIMSMFNIYVNIQNLIKGIILLAIVVGDKYIENKDNKI